MNLYEIDNAIMNCLTVDEETGEVTVDEETLAALQMERDAKVENIALWIKNLTADAVAIKAEKQALAERQAAVERKVERLKNYLANALAGQKFTTPRVAIGFRKTESVDIDEALFFDVPFNDSYMRVKKEPDKTKIKAALKSGANLVGATLTEKQSISIK